MGHIYRRPNSKSWWLDYQDAQGRRIRRSAKTSDEKQAQHDLARALAAVNAELGASQPEWQVQANKEPQPSNAILGLQSEVQGLKLRLAYYEGEVRRSRRRSAEILSTFQVFNKKFTYAREALLHTTAEIEHVHSALMQLIALASAD